MMMHYKDRHKLSLVIAGSFFIAAFITVFYIYTFTHETSSHTEGRPAMTAVFTSFAITFSLGSIALWFAFGNRNEVVVYREPEPGNRSLPEDDPHSHEEDFVRQDPVGAGPWGTEGSNGKSLGNERLTLNSELIAIYGEDETIRYISPSVCSILGYERSEMIGANDIGNVHPEQRASFSNIFIHMKQNPDEKITVQYAYKTKGGNYKWMESTGSNCIADPAVHGYVLISRDITERKLAEQEQRMRGKMQALSENSPDLILRLEQDIISYINPVIEFYTGRTPMAFLDKRVSETGLDPAVMKTWIKMAEQVNQTGGKITTEMNFPSIKGRRVMQVNAIPEFDDLENLESILIVSHDITERKTIEIEIQNKNRKITESINYARRIQSAILPNARLISRALPDSFVLYKPRDVVSGDFPWFAQLKNDIFIAAVDCTGHGVPGALLSLIGYFLLNDIIRRRYITDPGKILDLLDEGVTRTLRQDEDASTRDGMDISLCKINTAAQEIEFAGAHRPLYVVKKGVLQEIKGDKFPIGGGIFKNQTNFSNTRIKIDTGDSIYFFSDGFPDQFGGPQGRKFGIKRMREIISKSHSLPMKDARMIFNTDWENWKGNQKQTDDVLLIGIKF